MKKLAGSGSASNGSSIWGPVPRADPGCKATHEETGRMKREDEEGG